MVRRILLLTVVAFVVTTVSVYAMVATAQGKAETAPNCYQGTVTSLGQTPKTTEVEQLGLAATPS